MDITRSQTELEVIKKIMDDSRRIITDNGWHYIFWGVVVTCTLIANYIMVLAGIKPQYYGMMWFIVMVCTWVTEIAIDKRMQKSRAPKTFAGKLLNSLWSAAGVCMFVFGFIGILTGAYNPVYICPIISTVLGVAYIASGAIQQLRWMQMLSAGWWSGAVYMFLFPSSHTLLIFAVMIFFLQLTPGIVLYKKWKKGSAA